MKEVDWDIRLDGRAWSGKEAHERYQLSPEKIELIQGKLFWNEEDRTRMLGLLLENLGAAQAVRMGSPEVWRAAIATLDQES